MEATGTAAVLEAVQAAAPDVISNVGLAALAAVGVGIVLYGIRRVWRAFRGM
jgi:hypothetical protein